MIFRGDIEILKARLVHSNDQSRNQVFQFLAIVDFEATCFGRETNSHIQEIIEFPIVLIDVVQQTIVITLII